ncbi:permease family-domain-containing protein [Choanephora cucurbitarum]|nr:permease family-domain-containing protein [Choanephora cucurbitarum]
MSWVDKLNDYVSRTRFGRYFQLEHSGHKRERRGTKFSTELRAGLTIFFAMAYIISVNASVISESGGTCVCNATTDDPTCDRDADYMQCIYELKLDMIMATSIIAMISSILIGVFANLPLGMAPGMGLNAYFTYTVVGYHGSGNASYQTALAAVFLEGMIFFVLTIFGIRQWLARVIPMSIKVAMGCGIGLYLCFIGLQSSAGIGLVRLDYSTLVTLGGCPSDALDSNGSCQWGHMTSPTLYMGLLGLLLMAILLMYRVRGAILIAILAIAITSWPRNSPITYFPHTPQGDSMFDYFKKVVTVHNLQHVLGKFDFNFNNRQIWIALVTFLYVDILDTTGTMYSMARYGGFTDKAGDFEHSTKAFLADACCITVGSCFGSSSCTAFVESGAGIAEGGRTGITALTVAFGFFISIFFSPIFASFPPWSTGPALIIVGSMMTSSVRNINWDYPGDAIPSFITMAVMPFTYSIAYGVIGGIISYIIINGVVYIIDRITGGRVHPDYSTRENWWTAVLSRSFVPLWLRYVMAKIRGQPFDWHQDEYDFEDDNAAHAQMNSDNAHSAAVVIGSSSIHEMPSSTDLARPEKR